MTERDLAGRGVRAPAPAPARGRLPDARLGDRGRRRRAGGVAAAEPVGHRRRSQNLGGWLTTVVARVCLDMLRARRVAARGLRGQLAARAARQRSSPTGDPEQEALLADSVGLALLVVLDDAGARRAARVRAARHVRRAVRRDRADRRPHARPRRASSRAARGAGCAARRPSPTPTWRASARSSTPSSPRRARATSTRCSPCSIRTSSSASTAAAWRRARASPSAGAEAVARQVLARGGRVRAAGPGPRSSTAPPALVDRAARRAAVRGAWASRSAAAASQRSTSSRIATSYGPFPAPRSSQIPTFGGLSGRGETP